ncbi:hypothetical protein Tco_0863745, partial [Tanacetum coccineum]
MWWLWLSWWWITLVRWGSADKVGTRVEGDGHEDDGDEYDDDDAMVMLGRLMVEGWSKTARGGTWESGSDRSGYGDQF